MSFSPKYGMIMADGAGDARNGKTPLRGVCGAQNAAVAVRRAAVAASSHPVTKNARRRTYCTQNGFASPPRSAVLCKDERRAATFYRSLAAAFAAAVFLAAASPTCCLVVSARRAAVVDASTAQASVERAARGTGSPFAAAGIFRPWRASAGGLLSDRGDRVFAAGQPHFGGRRPACRRKALSLPRWRMCKTVGASAI